MSFYEGKYFEERDFYDWGIDYEIRNAQNKFLNDLGDIVTYRISFSKMNQLGVINIGELAVNEERIFDCYLENADVEIINEIFRVQDKQVLIGKYPWLEEIIKLEKDIKDEDAFVKSIFASSYITQLYIHNKMCFINVYTILDEYLSEIIKILGMYLNDFLSSINVKISYMKLKEFDNETDLREYFIDTAMINDKNISGALSKIKYLMKYLKLKKEISIDDIGIFNEERNCVVHNKGKYNNKAINNINKLSDKLSDKLHIALDGKVKLDNKKVDACIKLTERVILLFTHIILKEYDEFYKESFLDEIEIPENN